MAKETVDALAALANRNVVKSVKATVDGGSTAVSVTFNLNVRQTASGDYEVTVPAGAMLKSMTGNGFAAEVSASDTLGTCALLLHKFCREFGVK